MYKLSIRKENLKMDGLAWYEYQLGLDYLEQLGFENEEQYYKWLSDQKYNETKNI